MPKNHKLTKKELKVYRDVLIKERASILKGLSHITNETLKKSQREASGDLSGYSYHMADMASDVHQQDLLLKLASGEREHILTIEEAIRRVDDGEYGVCMGCDKKISKIRLKAMPTASYCRECQEKEEKGRV